MPFLAYVIIAIVAIILIFVVLFYLVKGLLILIGWFLKLIPTIIKATIYWAVAASFIYALGIMEKIPILPIKVYPLLYFVILVLILMLRYAKRGSLFKTSDNIGLALLLGGIDGIIETSDGEYKGFVLNKKSKVIHEKYSDSEDTISPHHRKELSRSEAEELINSNPKYHYKNK